MSWATSARSSWCPGQWSAKELEFHAENIATQLANNGAFNCNAARVIITHEGWPQREAFLDALRRTYGRIPQRHPYYPGARDRFATWVEANAERAETYGVTNERYLPWAFIPGWITPTTEDISFTQESFCGVQVETPIPAESIGDLPAPGGRLLQRDALGHAQRRPDRAPGDRAAPRAAIDQAIADLEYGSVVVNHWPALAYGFGVTTWGAWPGHTYQDIQSGLAWSTTPSCLINPKNR